MMMLKFSKKNTALIFAAIPFEYTNIAYKTLKIVINL